jgi:hypothetical protein
MGILAAQIRDFDADLKSGGKKRLIDFMDCESGRMEQGVPVNTFDWLYRLFKPDQKVKFGPIVNALTPHKRLKSLFEGPFE